MNIVNEIKKIAVLEVIRWIAVVSLCIMSVIGNYIFCDYNLYYVKNIIVFIFIGLAVCIVFTTNLGKLGLIFGKESCIELQKVVWPSWQDGFYTSLIVIAVTVMISLVLWGLDALAVCIISFGLRL